MELVDLLPPSGGKATFKFERSNGEITWQAFWGRTRQRTQ
jgi:hypothetical protein